MQLRCLLRVQPHFVLPKRCYVLGSQQGSTEYSSHIPPNTSARSNLQMNGWAIHGYGQVEELQCSNSLKMPQIRQANECLVRVQATSVNPIDVAMLGGYGATVFNVLRCQPGAIEFPLTLGREFCGELVQRGMKVTDSHAALGERVWGVVPLQSNGAHAEYVVVPDYCLSSAPANLSNAEAAAVLYAGLTAWSGLYVTGLLGGIEGALTARGGGANKRVLVLGGAGGVGSLAIQMLKAQNAQVLATCSENATELVQRLGADVVVDYKNPVEHETLRSCGPYDIILDCAGQGADYAKNLDLKFKQYITFSSPLLRNIDSSGVALGFVKNFADLVESNARVLSKQCGLVKWGFFAPAPQGIQMLKRLVERKKLLPLIDSSFGFKQMPAAYNKVASGHLRGKVVIDYAATEPPTSDKSN